VVRLQFALMAQPTAHPFKEDMVAKMGQTYHRLRQQRIARVSQVSVPQSIMNHHG